MSFIRQKRQTQFVWEYSFWGNCFLEHTCWKQTTGKEKSLRFLPHPLPRLWNKKLLKKTRIWENMSDRSYLSDKRYLSNIGYLSDSGYLFDIGSLFKIGYLFEGVCWELTSSEDSCACLGGSGLRLLTPLPRDPGNPRDPGMSSGRAPMIVKTQYTGPFFPENESIYPWNLRNPRNLRNPWNPRNPRIPRIPRFPRIPRNRRIPRNPRNPEEKLQFHDQ